MTICRQISVSIQVPICEVIHQEKRTEQNPTPTPSPPPGLGAWVNGPCPCGFHLHRQSVPRPHEKWLSMCPPLPGHFPPLETSRGPAACPPHFSSNEAPVPPQLKVVAPGWRAPERWCPPSRLQSLQLDHQQSLTVPKPTRAHPQAFALPLSLPLLLPAWPLLFFDFWLKQWFCGRAQTSG